jgi:hypothetical protein
VAARLLDAPVASVTIMNQDRIWSTTGRSEPTPAPMDSGGPARSPPMRSGGPRLARRHQGRGRTPPPDPHLLRPARPAHGSRRRRSGQQGSPARDVRISRARFPRRPRRVHPCAWLLAVRPVPGRRRGFCGGTFDEVAGDVGRWKYERPPDVPATSATPPGRQHIPRSRIVARRSRCRPMAACESDSCENARRAAAARERLRAAQQVRPWTAGRCGLDGRNRRSSVAVAATAGEWVSGWRRRSASSDRAASMRSARSALACARASA